VEGLGSSKLKKGRSNKQAGGKFEKFNYRVLKISEISSKAKKRKKKLTKKVTRTNRTQDHPQAPNLTSSLETVFNTSPTV
jgi:hypothetical protein